MNLFTKLFSHNSYEKESVSQQFQKNKRCIRRVVVIHINRGFFWYQRSICNHTDSLATYLWKSSSRSFNITSLWIFVHWLLFHTLFWLLVHFENQILVCFWSLIISFCLTLRNRFLCASPASAQSATSLWDAGACGIWGLTWSASLL